MSDEEDISDEAFFKKVVKSHWKALILFAVGIVGAIIGFFFVLYWIFLSNWVGGFGTWDIGQFSLGNILGLFFLVLFLELLIVAIPFLAYEGILFYLWWTRLPEEEKTEMKQRRKKGKKAKKVGGGGGFGILIFIVFMLLVFTEGNWETPINALPYLYWINNWFYALFWILIVLGIPGVIVAIIYFIKKKW